MAENILEQEQLAELMDILEANGMNKERETLRNIAEYIQNINNRLEALNEEIKETVAALFGLQSVITNISARRKVYTIGKNKDS